MNQHGQWNDNSSDKNQDKDESVPDGSRCFDHSRLNFWWPPSHFPDQNIFFFADVPSNVYSLLTVSKN